MKFIQILFLNRILEICRFFYNLYTIPSASWATIWRIQGIQKRRKKNVFVLHMALQRDFLDFQSPRKTIMAWSKTVVSTFTERSGWKKQRRENILHHMEHDFSFSLVSTELSFLTTIRIGPELYMILPCPEKNILVSSNHFAWTALAKESL